MKSTRTFVSSLALVCSIANSLVSAASPEESTAIVTNSIQDGPYIFIDENDQVTTLTLRNGGVEKIVSALNETTHIPTAIPSVPVIQIGATVQTPPASTLPMPEKLLAVSDLEGNLDHLISFLQFHGVIDNTYNWSWDKNHLLFNGDSVDRGNQVTELLWFIRKLQFQAKEAGGNVHFVLGNHEAMILSGDVRYIHPVYEEASEQFGIPYHELYSEQSVLGSWLRSQNSVVQIGEYIFVHAGYSPELDGLQLTHSEVNASIRKTLGPPAWPDTTDVATSLAWHRKGPFWYRGYFEKPAKKYGPKPTSEELDAILDRHQATAIVVGHTVTGTIGWLDGDKRLIGTDVHWDTEGEGQGLLLSNGKLIRVTMTETDETLEHVSTE